MHSNTLGKRKIILILLVLGGLVGLYFIGQSIMLRAEEPTFDDRLVDCAWFGIFKVWEDENANGSWDAGELGLKNIPFLINNQRQADFIKTDENGEYRAGGMTSCREDAAVVFQPVIPSGYRLTTPGTITIHTLSTKSGQTFMFGLTTSP